MQFSFPSALVSSRHLEISYWEKRSCILIGGRNTKPEFSMTISNPSNQQCQKSFSFAKEKGVCHSLSRTSGLYVTTCPSNPNAPMIFCLGSPETPAVCSLSNDRGAMTEELFNCHIHISTYQRVQNSASSPGDDTGMTLISTHNQCSEQVHE